MYHYIVRRTGGGLGDSKSSFSGSSSPDPLLSSAFNLKVSQTYSIIRVKNVL